MIDRFRMSNRSPRDVSDVMKWKNTSAETIPAYGVVKLDSYDTAGGFYNAIKPDGTGSLHFVNGPATVAVGAYGGSQLWEYSRIGLTTSTTFGAIVGPVSGSWNMEEGGSGFVVYSNPAGGAAAILSTGGGGGGTHRIWFTIVSVECVSATEMILTVEPTWYTGGCDATIPGADSYGHVLVEDICSILNYYVPTWLDGTDDGIPKKGSATYMWPRTGYCEPKWLVDEICQSPECA